MNLLKKIIQWIYDFSGTVKFFTIALIVFVLQCLWLAFSAIYPLPFDEYMHYGIIKIYALQWSPIIANQPASASLYGDITREPSYLFHYILSFPYRVFEFFVQNEQTLVIFLRLLNIGVFVAGVFLFRRLFIKWGLSKRVINVSTLIFLSTPIVPFLAAHINRDNLLFLLTPAFLICASNLLGRLDSKERLANTLSFLSIGMLTSLVKNEFLPIFFISGIFILVISLKRKRTNLTKRNLQKTKLSLKDPKIFLLLFLLIISLILFTERHALNFIKYGSVVPKCQQIQTVETCSEFMPWYRNNRIRENPPAEYPYGNPVSFMQHWASKMTRGYYAIFSHTPTEVISSHEPFGPIVIKPLLPLPIVVGYIGFLIGVICVAVNYRTLIKNKYLIFIMLLVVSYIVILLGYNYKGYLVLKSAQAIQARYTIPLLLPMIAVLTYAASLTIKRLIVRQVLLVTVIATYVWGGGIVGHLIRADETWYWQNPTVIKVNQNVQSVLRKIVIN